MKSLTGKSSSTRGWALLLILFLGAGLLVAACGDEETPAPTTPTPPPAPPPPAPEPEPEPEKPATPTGLQVASKTANSITWTWNAVEGAHGYVVQASADETFDETDQLALTIQPSYTATPLPADTSVYLRVAAGVLTAGAPSLDPSDYLLSDWTTHVTGTTDAAAAALAAPANVRETDTGSNFIEWSWDAVSGAAGYHAQFSRTESFSPPGADRPLLQDTSVRISNLPANTDGYLRVRAYTGSGTGQDTEFSDWSATDMASTGEPPPPPPATALDAPGNVQTSSVQNNSITVTWDDVIDAEEYAVEQRADGGSWDAASCGTGGTVTVTSCVASGLDVATDYDFRVKAFPDSADTTLTESPWSGTASATTTGTAPREPVAGGDNELNITWESDDTSITWFWPAASDTRITNLYVVLTPASAGERQGCPALNDQTTAWQTDMPYAIAHKVTGLTAGGGDVRGLCVRRTWTDDQDNPQYGPVSVAWAATSPAQPNNTPGAGEITAGPKDDSKTSRTTAIDWFVQMDKGFKYQVRTVSAQVGESLGTCADEGVGNTELSASSDNAHERFRLSSLQTYTAYKACVRATNDQGQSGWTEIGSPVQTLPTAPSGLTSSADFTTATGTVSGTITWRFGSSATTPEAPNGYDAVAFHNGTSAKARADSTATPLPDVLQLNCGNTNGGDVITLGTLAETGSGFEVSHPTAISLDRAANAQRAYTVTVLACVRAKLADAARTGGATTYGPWTSATRTVSVPKQTQ